MQHFCLSARVGQPAPPVNLVAVLAPWSPCLSRCSLSFVQEKWIFRSRIECNHLEAAWVGAVDGLIASTTEDLPSPSQSHESIAWPRSCSFLSLTGLSLSKFFVSLMQSWPRSSSLPTSTLSRSQRMLRSYLSLRPLALLSMLINSSIQYHYPTLVSLFYRGGALVSDSCIHRLCEVSLSLLWSSSRHGTMTNTLIFHVDRDQSNECAALTLKLNVERMSTVTSFIPLLLTTSSPIADVVDLDSIVARFIAYIANVIIHVCARRHIIEHDALAVTIVDVDVDVDEIFTTNIVRFRDTSDCAATIAATGADVTFNAKVEASLCATNYGEVLLQPLRLQSLTSMLLTYFHDLLHARQLTHCYDRRCQVMLQVRSFLPVLPMTKTSLPSTSHTTILVPRLTHVCRQRVRPCPYPRHRSRRHPYRIFLLPRLPSIRPRHVTLADGHTLNFDVTFDTVGLAANLADVTCAATLTKYFYSQLRRRGKRHRFRNVHNAVDTVILRSPQRSLFLISRSTSSRAVQSFECARKHDSTNVQLDVRHRFVFIFVLIFSNKIGRLAF